MKLSTDQTTAMNALTTVYTPPAWCANRFAVYSNTPPWDSTNVPSSGWVDPSFTQCIPEQYTATYPTFSPGICPQHMTMAAKDSKVVDGKTKWTGRCCQSGFTTPDIDPDYFCTSAVTAPIPLLVVPNITTTDIFTTVPDIQSVIHDQVTVVWEENDLSLFPREVAVGYASMMDITWLPALTNGVAATVVQTSLVSTGTSVPSAGPAVPSGIPSTEIVLPSTLPPMTAIQPVPTDSPVEPAAEPLSSSPSLPNSLAASSTIAGVSGTSSNPQTTIATQPQMSSYTSSRSSFSSPVIVTSTAVAPITAVPHSSSNTGKPRSRRVRNLFLAWTALYFATYLT